MKKPVSSSPDAQPFVGPTGEVDATSVTVRLFGDALDPAEISQRLGSEATMGRRKGDVISAMDIEQTAKTGSWLLSSERQSHRSLGSQIDALFDRLTDDLEVWAELTRVYKADLFCGLWSEAWNRGLQLSPTVLRKIADRGLKISFDIYFVDEAAR